MEYADNVTACTIFNRGLFGEGGEERESQRDRLWATLPEKTHRYLDETERENARYHPPPLTYVTTIKTVMLH